MRELAGWRPVVPPPRDARVADWPSLDRENFVGFLEVDA
jgi:hypothetical protein